MTRREWLALPLLATAVRGGASSGEVASRGLRLDPPADFDVGPLRQALRAGHVTTIEVVAKGKDGLARYNTAIGVNYPGLRRDLLGEIIAVCRSMNIGVTYMYALMNDAYRAREHPEWSMAGQVCLNTPYFDRVIRENREIVEKYEVSGARFTGLTIPESGCTCRACAAERKQVDPREFGHALATRVERALAGVVGAGSVCFEGRPADALRTEAEFFTHFEPEQEHTVRFLRTLNKDCVGLAGSAQQAFAYIANGAKVTADYPVDGALYARLRALEKWTSGCRAVADIGLLTASRSSPGAAYPSLVQLHQQFNLADVQSDFALYKLLLVAEDVMPTAPLLKKMEAYVERGGAVLAAGPACAGPLFGVTTAGAAPFEGKLQLGAEIFGDRKGVLISQSGTRIKPTGGTEVLARCGDEAVITRRGQAVLMAVALPEYFGDLLRALLIRPSVISPADLPAQAQVTMLEQRTQGNLRRIVHVVYPGVLENVRLAVGLPQHPLGVVLIPSEQPLEFKHNEFYTTFTVPRIDGHQAIAFE